MSARAPFLPVRHLVHRLDDPAQFGQAVSGASLVADFLAPARCATRVEQFQTPAWALDYHEAHVKARILGPLPPGWISLGFMRGAAASAWYGVAASAGALACTPPGAAIDGCITPGFGCLAVGLSVTMWEECRALAGVEKSTFGSGLVLHLPPPLSAHFERRLLAVRHALRAAATQPGLTHEASAAASRLAVDFATTAWELSTTTPSPRIALRNRARLARRAEAWMRDHLAEPVRVPDACRALRVSRRELEYAFRTVFDQSPRDFLHALRLNAVRRALRRPAARGTVLETLLAHGLTHAGRFATDYRTLFGESPAQSLARR